jgi:hypothetical protein
VKFLLDTHSNRRIRDTARTFRSPVRSTARPSGHSAASPIRGGSRVVSLVASECLELVPTDLMYSGIEGELRRKMRAGPHHVFRTLSFNPCNSAGPPVRALQNAPKE